MTAPTPIADRFHASYIWFGYTLWGLACDHSIDVIDRRFYLDGLLGGLPPERRVPVVATLLELSDRYETQLHDGTPSEDRRLVLAAGHAVALDAAWAVAAAAALAVREYRRWLPPSPAYGPLGGVG